MAEFEDLMAAMNEPGYVKEEEKEPEEEVLPPEEDDEDEYEEDDDDDDEDDDDDDDDYRERRPRKRRKRRKKHYFLRFIIFVALIVGGVKFLNSDYFWVTQIKVEGNHYYTKAQIVEMAGIKTGYNLFFETKTSPARATLLDDPYIKLVSIKKEPRDTVRIIIEEREEYAAIPYGENYILIDRDGMVLRISDKEPILPLLDGMTLVEMRPGSALAVEQSYLLTDTLALIEEMDENDIYFKKINFSSVVVRAYIYDELYCEGTPENIKNNMSKIYQLLTSLYQDDITHGAIKVGTDGYVAYSPVFD